MKKDEITKDVSREIWVDNVKVIACIFVVLGHFFQSMTKADILPESGIYQWFNQTIYYFHVSLFFICSGYLHQKYLRIFSPRNWARNVLKKFIILGIPYFTFSIITLLMKKIFESAVNSSEGGFIETLFFNPTSPYWYLYVLFFIFLITPSVKGWRQLTIIAVMALILKIMLICGLFEGFNLPYAMKGIMNNEIWFVIGMVLCVLGTNKVTKGIDWIKASSIGIIFIILSIVVYELGISVNGISFLMGIMACTSIVLLIIILFKERPQMKVFDFLTIYTLPIFLMHTIFAAGLRSVLLKLGISNAAIHVVLGIGISFAGPIIAAVVMEKSKVLEIFLYTNKFIKVRV